ncbi:DNA-binding protein (plasmid) [Streptomyces sp. BI20]|uniref:nSTAND1 domain-containing NTPase n=1 Tax=Streptomyces sp. BI20 TaxID=3403460 RepID=UPI003C738AE0
MGRPEKALDPQAGPVERFACELRALRVAAGSVPYRELAARAGYSVTALSQAAAGARLPSLPVALAYVGVCGGDPVAWEERWRAAEAELLALPADGADAGAAPPYRGLTRFEPEDEAVFFGRERLTEALTALVAEHRVTVVLGPSGSGKSSLLRAGLIPRLRRGAAPLPAASALRILTPGEHPARTHGAVLAPAAGPGDTWLVVDQFEELFTLCADPDERREFLDALLAARRPDSRIRVVLGVRADFYANCLAHPELAEAARVASLPVGPLTPEEVRGAIVRPATAAGLTVERALTARLVEEVTREPGGLPLLSHALLETWRRRRGRLLTLAGHEAAGGLRGALAQTAEEVYAALGEDRAPVARRLLLSLITPGADGVADTRRPVPRDTLVPPGSATAEEAGAVLDRLAKARLVTLDHEVVDLAHEALITAWPRLRDWIESDRERLRLHRRLTQATENWLARDRDAGTLLRGGELAEAETAFAPGSGPAADELSPPEAAFLRAGLTARTRTRRLRHAVTAVVAVLLVLLTVAGTTAWDRGRANEARAAEAAFQEKLDRARTTELDVLQAVSKAERLRRTESGLAQRLGVAAWRLAPGPETEAALVAAAGQAEVDVYDVPDTTPPERPADRIGVELSADGRVVTVSTATAARSWDVRRKAALGPSMRFGQNLLGGISPDGRTAVVMEPLVPEGDRIGARRLDLVSGRAVDAVPRPVAQWVSWTDAPNLVMQDVIDTSDDRRLSLRDVRDDRVLLEVPTGRRPVWAVSPDGRRLAVCARETEPLSARERAEVPLRVFDVTRGRELPARRPGGCAMESFAFTGDGAALAVRTTTGVSLWEPDTGRERVRIAHPGLTEVTTSPDGRFLVGADGDEVLLWRLAAPERPVFRYPLVNEVASGLRIDPRDGVIRYLTEHRRGDRVVRSISYGPAMTSRWNPDAASAGVFSADGTAYAVARRRGGESWFETYSVADGRRTARTPAGACPAPTPLPGGGHATDGCRSLLALSPDGRTLAHTRTPMGPDAASDTTEPAIQEPGLWDTGRDRALPLPPQPSVPAGARSPITGLAVSRDGRSLFTTRSDVDVVDVRELPSGRRTRPEDLGSDRVDVGGGALPELPGPLAVRPGGRTLASSARVFPTGAGRGAERGLGIEDGAVLAWSSDGTWLAVGDTTGGVTIWDGELRRRMRFLAAPVDTPRVGAVEAVTALAFSPDGQYLAVGGASGTLRLWDTRFDRALGTLPTPGDAILALSYSPDGRTLRAVGAHSGLSRVEVAPERLVARVCARAGGSLTPAEWRNHLPIQHRRELC